MLLSRWRACALVLTAAGTCLAKNITIDDNDPIIQYSTPVCPSIYQCDQLKSWWVSTDAANPPAYANGTTHVCNGAGLSAQMPFKGTDIYMHTSISPSGGAASVVVDANTPVQVDTKTTFTDHRVPIFHLGGLNPDKQHTITITHAAEEGYFEIDFFAVIVPDDTSSSTTSSASTTPSPSPSATPKSPSTKKASVGPIVGGVIAVLALLALVAVGFWYFRRRRINRRLVADWTIAEDTDAPPQYGQVIPYDSPTYATTSTDDVNERTPMSMRPPKGSPLMTVSS